MKTLQNDLTTIEQSKRLLELGVPKNSANHYYGKDGNLYYIDGTIPYSLLWEIGCTPCWSVGQLIEIARTCLEERRFKIFIALMIWKNPIVQLMKLYEAFGKEVNFSKLED